MQGIASSKIQVSFSVYSEEIKIKKENVLKKKTEKPVQVEMTHDHLLSLLLRLDATCQAGDPGGEPGEGRLDGDL